MNDSLRAYRRKKRRLYARIGDRFTECIICGMRWNLGQEKQYALCPECEAKRKGWLAVIPARMKDGKMTKKGQTLMLPGNAIHLLMRNTGKFIGQDIITMKPKMVRALRKKFNLLLANMELQNENAGADKE